MFFFRVDSNSIIAGGHIMRCIALANNLKKNREKVLFLIADENPVAVLNQYQMEYEVLNTDWRNLMTDKDIVIEYLKNAENSVLIIDTYHITKEYVEAIKPFCQVVYLGSKKEYLGGLNMLINYSSDIDYKFYFDKYGNTTELLLGPTYAPLREEFQNKTHVYKSKIERILLTTGNTDRENIIGQVLKKVIDERIFSNIVFEVIIGRMFENKEQLYALYDGNSRVIFHENIKEMSSLIDKCDLALSANGTTVYELSAMGVPTISFALVEEQIRSAETLSELGAVDYCGCVAFEKEKCISKIVERLNYYIRYNDKLIELARKSHSLIDGKGCQRIVNAVQKLIKE